MTTRSAWASLVRWFGGPRRRRVARIPDFADHGTAFGLELSLAPDVMPTPELNPAHTAMLARSGPTGKRGRSLAAVPSGR
jgi:hypothetical protein